jgi:hypothetical protein
MSQAGLTKRQRKLKLLAPIDASLIITSHHLSCSAIEVLGISSQITIDVLQKSLASHN